MVRRALLAALLLSPGAALAEEAPETARIVAEYRIPSGLAIASVPFGGLSEIDFDPATASFVAISDDRSSRGPARAYRLAFALNPEQERGAALQRFDILAALPLFGPTGTLYPEGSIDPESLRLLPDGGFYLSSEGDAKGRPTLSVFSPEGAWIADFETPDYHMPAEVDGAPVGVRRNRAYEAIAIASDGRVAVAMESALHQDGPEATLEEGASVRITFYDPQARAPIAEYVYQTDPIAVAPVPADAYADNGVVAMLARPEGGYYVLERSFSLGVGTTVKLFRVSFQFATDVLGEADLGDVTHIFADKTLVTSLTTGVELPHVDNLEGMTFGPEINGKRSLVLISDDNFNIGVQYTQLVVLTLE